MALYPETPPPLVIPPRSLERETSTTYSSRAAPYSKPKIVLSFTEIKILKI